MSCARLIWVTLVSTGLSCAILRAQESGAEPLETRVIVVSHINSQGIGVALSQLGYDLTIATPDPGRIVLRGEKEEIARALVLVQELDSPKTQASEEGAVAYIPLKQHPVNLMHLVETVAPAGPGTAYALDPIKRMLVVRGSQETISRVREVVEAIDRPAEAFTLDFYFIRGAILPEGERAKGNIPAALASVAESLGASGFRSMTLLAPVTISARQGEPFSSVSGLNFDSEEFTFSVEGTADVSDGGKNVQLKLQADVKARQETESADGRGSSVTNAQVFSARTTISTSIGKYTVLAAGPSAEGDNSAMALAIRVRRAE